MSKIKREDCGCIFEVTLKQPCEKHTPEKGIISDLKNILGGIGK